VRQGTTAPARPSVWVETFGIGCFASAFEAAQVTVVDVAWVRHGWWDGKRVCRRSARIWFKTGSVVLDSLACCTWERQCGLICAVLYRIRHREDALGGF
jgi:hypothetical protein